MSLDSQSFVPPTAPETDRRLVVTADDFGAALAVNEAIELAHRRGVLTAASLMVGAPAADDAVARAKRTPTLRVGLHLVLAEGRPVLPAGRVRHLVDRAGMFRTDMAALGARIFFDPAARRQLEEEIEAQFAAFAATGLALDHVNAHKHFHLHPTITGLMLKIGARHGLRAARAPVEPRRVLARLEPGPSRSIDLLVGAAARICRARIRAAGVLAPDQVFGLAWSGAFTAPRLHALLQALPSGLSEIYLHPGLCGGFEGAAPGYRYGEEYAALTDLDVVRSVRRPGITLGGFADFVR